MLVRAGIGIQGGRQRLLPTTQAPSSGGRCSGYPRRSCRLLGSIGISVVIEILLEKLFRRYRSVIFDFYSRNLHCF
jgi:hypothetical protein